jgi:hypothetical protein
MTGLSWILCLCIGLTLVIAGISLLIFTPQTNVVTIGLNVNQGASVQMTVTSSVSITIERANAIENSNSTVTNSTLP